MTLVGELGQGLLDLAAQAGVAIAIVVEVELDLTVAETGERGQVIKKVSPVLVAGEEERVAGRTAIGIAEVAGHERIAAAPGLRARVTNLLGSLAPEGLEVVAEREHEVAWPWRWPSPQRLAHPEAQVASQPGVQVLGENTLDHAYQVTFCRRRRNRHRPTTAATLRTTKVRARLAMGPKRGPSRAAR